MNNDIENEEYEHDEYIIPPRSSLHGTKDEEKGSSGIIQILVGSFIFILIILAAIFLFFNFPGDETADNELDNNSVVEDDYDSPDNQFNDSNNPDTQVIDNDNLESDNNDSSNTGGLDNDSTDIIDSPNEEDLIDTADEKTHIIQAGENLYRISIKYYQTGIYYNAIAKYNELENSDDIYAGMKIKIPKLEVIKQYSD